MRIVAPDSIACCTRGVHAARHSAGLGEPHDSRSSPSDACILICIFTRIRENWYVPVVEKNLRFLCDTDSAFQEQSLKAESSNDSVSLSQRASRHRPPAAANIA
jgi:hypothetical protein